MVVGLPRWPSQPTQSTWYQGVETVPSRSGMPRRDRKFRRLEAIADGFTRWPFSADSKYIVSGSVNRPIKIWDTGTGQEIQTLKGHDSSVCSVAFLADSKYV